MTPLLIDGDMLLKYNVDYWGDELVDEAIRCDISERNKNGLKKLIIKLRSTSF